jgi:pilus assembly protein CpaE
MPAQEKIKVLIVDDIADTRENLKRLLQFDQIIEVIGAARSGREAIEMSHQLKPDVVIMDINMPDMDGITATEAIRRKAPYTQVVILSVQSDASYMRRAMLAGARDFLTKPPMIDELTAAIRRAGAMAADERSKAPMFPMGPAGGAPNAMGGPGAIPQYGKVIVVYSPKGGTGKTTIATNLALALQSEETRTLLIDTNVQFGDVAVFLNEQVKNNILDLTPRVDELDREFIEEIAVMHNASGLRILAAPTKPELAENVGSEEFSKLLDFLRQMYSYIVIDTASYLSVLVQSALDCSDVIVLITTQDIPSIKNANSFLMLADSSGIKRDRILFIMNRFDKRISISPERVGESLRQEILASVPFDEKIVATSVNRGVPFILDNKTQPIGKSIMTVADLVKEKLTKLDEAKAEAAAKK